MKTTLSWGTKNTGAKFNITASDLQSACDALCGNKEWGHFSGDISYDSKGDAQKNVSSIVVKAGYTITMPAWGVLSKQPKACQDEWNRMWKALRAHEDGHLDVFNKGVAALVKTLTALKSGTHDDIDAVVNKALKDIQMGHDKYDASTTHGQKEGVKLDITEECGGGSE